MADRIRLRRDTAANWLTANPILALAEAGYETDTGKFKFGDGVKTWTQLTYSAKSVNWLGAYNSSTAYAILDAVSYQGQAYICKAATTGNLPTNTAKWDLMAAKGADGADGADGTTGPAGSSLVWRGIYDNATEYSYLDVVSYQGQSYICKALSLGYLPTNTIKWDLMASKGSDGSSIIWKGTYDNATTYAVLDAVFYGGQAYICKSATTGNLPTDTAKWDLMAAKGADGSGTGVGSGLSWKGAYDNATAYVISDAVSYEGSSYICTANSTGHLPTDTNFWGLMSAKGDSGTCTTVAGATSSRFVATSENQTTFAPILGYTSTNVEAYLVSVGAQDQAPTVNYTITAANGGSLVLSDGVPIGTVVLIRALNAVQNSGNGGGADGASIVWKGAYNGATTYAVLDAVSYNGQSYICKAATTGNLPTDTAKWDLMAAKGADGADGADGSNSGNATQIQGVGVSAATPTDAQVIAFDAATQEYKPTTLPAPSVTFARTRYLGNGLQKVFYPIQGYIDNDETKYLVTVSSLLIDSDETNGDFVITAANGGTLTFTGSTPADNAKVVCRVLGGSGNLEVAKKAVTQITQQPQTQNVISGSAYTFSVTATGAAPISYQWYVNGQIAIGETSATITGTATTQMNNDTYYVVVNGAGGQVTSNTVSLGVTSAAVPVFTLQPVTTKSVASTNTFSLSVEATGATSYQWQKRGPEAAVVFSDVNGATTATYLFTAPENADQPPQTIEYRCIASNADGDAISNVCTITLYKNGITILSSGGAVSVNDGGTAPTITMDALASSLPLTYSWEVSTDGGNNYSAAGSTTKTLTLPNTLQNSGNKYRCLVNDGGGVSETYGTIVWTLTVNAVAPTIEAISDILTSNFILSVPAVVAGSEPITYEWQTEVNGTWTTFATGSTLGGSYSTYGLGPDVNIRLLCTNAAGSAYRQFNYKSINEIVSVSGFIAQTYNADTTVSISVNVNGGGYTNYLEANAAYAIYASASPNSTGLSEGDTTITTGNFLIPNSQQYPITFTTPSSSCFLYLQISNAISTSVSSVGNV